MKFRVEKKMIVKVRYYENLFFIRDSDGETLFAGMDEQRAKDVCKLLNVYVNKKVRTVKTKRSKK